MRAASLITTIAMAIVLVAAGPAPAELAVKREAPIYCLTAASDGWLESAASEARPGGGSARNEG